MLDTVLQYQDKILKCVSNGCDIRQHCRPFLPEGRTKVNHVHFHLIPRTFKDELYARSQVCEEGIFKQLPEAERDTFCEIYSR